MRPNEAPRPLSQSLGTFSVRSLDRLNHVAELLVAADESVNALNVPAKVGIRHLLGEAHQEVLAVMKKPAAAFERWHQRNAPAAIEADNG